MKKICTLLTLVVILVISGCKSFHEHDWQLNTELSQVSCTKDGYLMYICSDCGEQQKEFAKATGHVYDGKICTKCGLDDYENPLFRYGLTPVKKNGVYVYIDKSGKVAIDKTFENAKKFLKRGVAEVSVDGKKGIINTKGEYVVEPAYESVEIYDCDSSILAAVELNGKWGIVNSTGKLIAQCEYDRIEDDTPMCGLVVVRKNEKYGAVNANGQLVISCIYDDLSRFFENGLSAATIDGAEYLIDTSGNVVYDFAKSGGIPGDCSSDKVFKIQFGLECKLFDSSGKLSDMGYESIGDFAENGLARVKLDGKYGFIDESGKVVITCRFEDVSAFAEPGYALAKINGKYGLINESGEFIVEPEFDKISPFNSNGMAAVEVNGLMGFIDQSGKIVIEPQFADISMVTDFAKNGLALVKQLDGSEILIDESGNRITDLNFESAYPLGSSGCAIVKIDEKYGVINKKGEIVLQPQFLRLENFDIYDENGWVDVSNGPKKEKLYGLIDSYGKVLVEPGDRRILTYSDGFYTVFSNKNGIRYEAIYNSKGEMIFLYEGYN